MFFSCYNLKYEKHLIEDWVIAIGEVKNESGRDFTTVVFKAKIYMGEEHVGSALVKIHGFRAKATKPFEATFEGSHRSLIPKISKFEMIMESAY